MAELTASAILQLPNYRLLGHDEGWARSVRHYGPAGDNAPKSAKILSIMKLRSRVALVSAALTLVTFTAIAKRAPARPVASVESDGIRYSADRYGRDQYVAATDVATGKRLWRVRVFHTFVKPWIEEDVQWVFITDLEVVGNSLFVRDEKDRCYAVDVRDHRVHKVGCGVVFAKQESTGR